MDDSTTSTSSFLTDLLALCVRYGVTIGGCGCCDSPWVRGSGINLSTLQANYPSGTYPPDADPSRRLIISQGDRVVSAEVVSDDEGG